MKGNQNVRQKREEGEKRNGRGNERKGHFRSSGKRAGLNTRKGKKTEQETDIKEGEERKRKGRTTEKQRWRLIN